MDVPSAPSFAPHALDALVAQSAAANIVQQQHKQQLPSSAQPHLYPDFDLVPTLLPDSQIANIDTNYSMHPQQLQSQPQQQHQLEQPQQQQQQQKPHHSQEQQHAIPPLQSLFMASTYDTSTSGPLSLSSQFLASFPTHQNPPPPLFPAALHQQQQDIFLSSQEAATIGASTLDTADDFPLSSADNSPTASYPTKLPPSSLDSNQQLPTPSSAPAEPMPLPEPAPPSRKRAKPSSANSTEKSATSKETRNGRKRTRTRTEDMDPSLVHTCPTCGKKFAKKYNQKIHQRRHQGDLPFVCEYDDCGKGFMWRSSFLRHLKVHDARPERPRKAHRKSADTSSDARSPSEVDVMQVSENASIMLLNGMKVEVDHFGLESINAAVALCRLNGTTCRELLDINVDAIRQADEQIVNTRHQYVNSTKQMPLNLSHVQIAHIHFLLSQRQPTGSIPTSLPT